MNRNLWLLAVLQGLFLTNNVTFIAINGLVGLSLAPYGWMATLPVMGYVVGSALCTGPVAYAQARLGRSRAFQLGLAVALGSALLCAYAASTRQFWLLCAATLLAGYYNANATLYRFASAELAAPSAREKAVSLVMAGGLLGAVIGPNLAARTRNLADAPFVGAYLALAVTALLAMLLLAFIRFPPVPPKSATRGGRTLGELFRVPAFLVVAAAGALGYGVMNLLMAATPLAMQFCGLSLESSASVIQWHILGMFLPAFVAGPLVDRLGSRRVALLGIALLAASAAVALAGLDHGHFLASSLLLGMGWNLLLVAGTTLLGEGHGANERGQAQGLMEQGNSLMAALMSFSSGALITSLGWSAVNLLVWPVLLLALALLWPARRRQPAGA